jgi:hypothetical protein
MYNETGRNCCTCGWDRAKLFLVWYRNISLYHWVCFWCGTAVYRCTIGTIRNLKWNGRLCNFDSNLKLSKKAYRVGEGMSLWNETSFAKHKHSLIPCSRWSGLERPNQMNVSRTPSVCCWFALMVLSSAVSVCFYMECHRYWPVIMWQTNLSG